MQVINYSGADMVIQGITLLGDQTPYSLPNENAVAWSKDVHFRIQLLYGNLELLIDELVMPASEVLSLLDAIAGGLAVVA